MKGDVLEENSKEVRKACRYGDGKMKVLPPNGFCFLKEHKFGQVWCLTPVIPALREVEAGRSQGQ